MTRADVGAGEPIGRRPCPAGDRAGRHLARYRLVERQPMPLSRAGSAARFGKQTARAEHLADEGFARPCQAEADPSDLTFAIRVPISVKCNCLV